MMATGIVRRIDDLGRVVIPKELRRSLHIRENAPLEFFIEDGKLVMQKYNPEKASDLLKQAIDLLEDQPDKQMYAAMLKVMAEQLGE